MWNSLAEYRRVYQDAERILSILRADINAAISNNAFPGFGKTYLIAKAMPQLLEMYPRVIYAASQHSIKNEFSKNSVISSLKPTIVRFRDERQCGDLSLQWSDLQRLNLQSLGRSEICSRCEHKCDWYRTEEDEKKGGSSLTLMTTEHLFRAAQTIPESTLIIIDEISFLLRGLERVISRDELFSFIQAARGESFKDVREAATELMKSGSCESVKIDRYTRHELLRRLLDAGVYNFTPYLENPNRYTFKPNQTSIQVVERRFKHHPLIVVGFGTDKVLLEYFFDRKFHDVSPPRFYKSPETQFYQLAVSASSLINFRRKSRTTMVRTAVLYALRSFNDSTKVVFVAKQEVKGLFIDSANKYAKERGLPFRFISHDDGSYDGRNIIPVIHYGIAGVNDFETYQRVFCVNAYNISPKHPSKNIGLNSTLAELGLGTWKTEIKLDAVTGRRFVKVVDARRKSEGVDIQLITEKVLKLIENNTILQAVGRVRPWGDEPKEVVFAGFQEFDDIDHTFRFNSDFERFLGIDEESFGLDKDSLLIKKITTLEDKNLTMQQIGERIGVTRQTVSKLMKKRNESLRF